jgi:hypothetical protein
MDPNQLVATLTANIMGYTVRQQEAIEQNGWVSLQDFTGYGTTEIKDWTYAIDRRPATRGGCSFGSVATQKLQALNFWINQQGLRGHAITINDFDEATMRTAMEDYKVAELENKTNSDATIPEKFSYENWIDWQQSVITYLKAKKSIKPSIPLYYIIRPEPRVIPINLMTPTDEIVYNTAHAGRAFDTDNREVHRILDELTLGSDAADWIKSHRRRHDGRAAWTALCNHYDGPAEGDKRVTVARANIDSAFYKNESTFSFEKYSTRLKKAYDTLRQYNQPKSSKEEVDILLKNINTNNVQLSSCIAICRAQHAGDFNDATTYLGTQIAQIFPQSQPGSNNRNRARPGNNRRRNVSSIIRKNGKVTSNGVDLTDTTRYFTKKEWDKMSPQAIKLLHECPKRKARKEELSKTRSKKSRVSATHTENAGDTPDAMSEHSRQVAAAVINGVMRASASLGDDSTLFPPSVPGGVNMPQHGTHARNASAASTRSQRQQRRYDEFGNVIQE